MAPTAAKASPFLTIGCNSSAAVYAEGRATLLLRGALLPVVEPVPGSGRYRFERPSSGSSESCPSKKPK